MNQKRQKRWPDFHTRYTTLILPAASRVFSIIKPAYKKREAVWQSQPETYGGEAGDFILQALQQVGQDAWDLALQGIAWGRNHSLLRTTFKEANAGRFHVWP
jgi:hypothetical protein